MRRLLLNLLTVLSLLLCVALGVVWAATNRTQAHVRFHLPRVGRFTLYSQYGEVRLFGLPPPSPAARRLLPIAGRIRNDDVDWDAIYNQRKPSSPSSPFTISPEARRGTASHELLEQVLLRRAARADLVHPLVEALEDPDRFVAAHALLAPIAKNALRMKVAAAGETVHGEYDGLPVELDTSRSEKIPVGEGWSQFRLRHRGPAVAIDPGAQAAVRDHWHTTLHVPLRTVPYWPFAAAAGVLPAVRAASALRLLPAVRVRPACDAGPVPGVRRRTRAPRGRAAGAR